MAEVLEDQIADLDDYDKQTDGDTTTRRTLAALGVREKQYPGAVGTVIVHFRDCFEDWEAEVLSHATRCQCDRQARHKIAVKHAERVQRELRSFLKRQGTAESFFGANRSFRQFHEEMYGKPLPVTNTLIGPANSALVARLWEYDEVIAIELDRRILRPVLPVVGPLGSSASGVFGLGAGGSSKYTWGWKRLGLERLHESNWTGTGIKIGIADSGVCERHEDLRGKVLDFAKVEPQGELVPAHSFDESWHGTHCAGILVGNSASGTQIGGAPDAKLNAASILNLNGGWYGDLLRALEWLGNFEKPSSVDVVNLSIGFEEDRVREVDVKLLELKLKAFSKDVLFVAAIGNDPARSTYPGKFGVVLSAGAIDEHGEVAEFSGGKPDLVLPGVEVYSSIPAGREEHLGASYLRGSGTSHAAPHLSALAGLVMQACPDAAPLAVAEALKRTASRAGQYDRRLGWGVPNAGAAIDLLRQEASRRNGA
jgi:subtilisin family serine protease